MNADGSELKKLTDSPYWNGHICWSPDGKKIAFVTVHGSENYGEDKSNYYEIYIMNTDGSSQKRLTNNTCHDSPVCWSPDGQKITFISDRDGNSEIYVMNADGLQLKRLTNSPEVDTLPSWSPDGKQIAFVRYNLLEGRGDERFKNAEIYIMNADGSGQRRLTDNAESDLFPSWSPDGQKIVFYSKRDGNHEIYIMNPDSSEQIRLTNHPAEDLSPCFQPFLR
jgi:Tol biopolymer transport system component